MFSFLKRAVSATAETVTRGFDSIRDRLEAAGEHLLQAIEHPFAPPGLKVGLPMLLDIIDDLHQEVAELRKPCPCDGHAPTPTNAAPGDAVGGAAASSDASSSHAAPPVDLVAKWPTYADQLLAFNTGLMNDAEAAVFRQLQDKVNAFAASVIGAPAHA